MINIDGILAAQCPTAKMTFPVSIYVLLCALERPQIPEVCIPLAAVVDLQLVRILRQKSSYKPVNRHSVALDIPRSCHWMRPAAACTSPRYEAMQSAILVLRVRLGSDHS